MASAGEKALDLPEFCVFWGSFLVARRVPQVSQHFWARVPFSTVDWLYKISELSNFNNLHFYMNTWEMLMCMLCWGEGLVQVAITDKTVAIKQQVAKIVYV